MRIHRPHRTNRTMAFAAVFAVPFSAGVLLLAGGTPVASAAPATTLSSSSSSYAPPCAAMTSPHAASTALTMGAVGGPDIVDVAASAGSFETLLAAAKAAGLVDVLRETSPLTVFAPTDEAFAKLPAGTIDALLKPENRDQLAAILSLHVVAGEALPAADLARRTAVRTLDGSRLPIDLGASGLTAGTRSIVAADIEASNGVIHVIDEVILPPSDSIAAVATKAGSFGTLLAAVNAAGLADALAGDGPFTVFAPTDEAFAKIPGDTLAALLEPRNRQALVEILTLHVVPGRVYAEDALGGASASTLNGEPVNLRFERGALRANDARVVATDIGAANGVVHVIDTVLLPKDFAAPSSSSSNANLVIGVFTTEVSHEIRDLLRSSADAGLGIDRVAGDGGARDAGLESGDVILAVDGKPATSASLRDAKQRAGDGGTVRVLVVREVEIEVRDDH
ncbi:MAG: fasciclin domain-containing protein [Phycisphaerales bacterium]